MNDIIEILVECIINYDENITEISRKMDELRYIYNIINQLGQIIISVTEIILLLNHVPFVYICGDGTPYSHAASTVPIDIKPQINNIIIKNTFFIIIPHSFFY